MNRGSTPFATPLHLLHLFQRVSASKMRCSSGPSANEGGVLRLLHRYTCYTFFCPLRPNQKEREEHMPVSYESFDSIAFFERYSRLRPNSRVGKQWQGACPFDDCPADDDGFIVWPTLTDKGCHYYCRVCGRAGDA